MTHSQATVVQDATAAWEQLRTVLGSVREPGSEAQQDSAAAVAAAVAGLADPAALLAGGVAPRTPEKLILVHVWAGDIKSALKVLPKTHTETDTQTQPNSVMSTYQSVYMASRQAWLEGPCVWLCVSVCVCVCVTQVALEHSLLSADLVSACASLGRPVWAAASRLYAAQQETAGQVHVAAMHLIAIGDRPAAAAAYRYGRTQAGHALCACCTWHISEDALSKTMPSP